MYPKYFSPHAVCMMDWMWKLFYASEHETVWVFDNTVEACSTMDYPVKNGLKKKKPTTQKTKQHSVSLVLVLVFCGTERSQ